MSEMIEFGMANTIEGLARDSIQTKLKGLPSSQLMKVDDVADILLDLQQELLGFTVSVSEPVPA